MRRTPLTPEPPLPANPERGAVGIKPADYDLDALQNEAQTRRYLDHYGLVLITNFREFRLLQLRNGSVHSLEAYTLAGDAPRPLVRQY